MLRHLLGLRSNRRGVAAVEFAAVTPLMLLMAGGVFEVGALLEADSAVNRLAMQYAFSYAACSDTSVGACQTILTQCAATAALGYMAPQIPTTGLTLSMAQVKMNGTTPTVEYIYPTGSSLSATQTTALQATVGDGQNGVVVTVTYPYQLLIFQTLMTPIIGSSFNLSYTVAQLK